MIRTPRPSRRRLWGAAIAVLAGAATLAAATWVDLASVPASLPPHADGLEPPVLARDGTPLTVSRDTHLNDESDLPLSAIPPLVREGFVFSEDQRFWVQGGSDWRARFTALLQNLRAGHIVRGASTIGEQAARIITPRPRTYWSHWLAGIEAQRLIARFGRAGVLDFYLNEVPYGAERRGIAQAARYYFGDELAALDPAEQLALVVLVRSPQLLDPRQHRQALRRAVDRLAARMRRANIIDDVELRAVRLSPLAPVPPPGLPVVAGAFVGFVRNRVRALDLQPSQVRTTLDPGLQRFVQNALATQLRSLREAGVREAAALVVDNRRAEVLAWAAAPAASAEDLDPVTMPRQPGSTLKPFLYALALERLGWQPDTVLRDGPLSTRIGDGIHDYRNYSNRYYGRVSLRYALGNSLNIPAVETAEAVGVERFIMLLGRLGVTSLTRPAEYYGPAVAIGDGPVSLYELVQAYSALARHGRFLPLRVLREVPAVQPVAVLQADVTSAIASILSDPDARSAEFGSDSVLDLPYPTAVKTGTSSNFRDALAVGFDDRYTVGVWMGRLDDADMSRVTGSAGPAPVLRTIFARLRELRPYAGLWRSPELRPVRACERMGPGPCVRRGDWWADGNIPVGRPQTMRARREIVQPTAGEALAIDPRIPLSDQLYTFRICSPGGFSGAVVWFLDGRFLARTASSKLSWRLSRGEHVLTAKIWPRGSPHAAGLRPVSFQVE
ncbi:MAG: transglycosylase domain-containing protein [Steroidobacteraceae bacterium]